MTPEEYLFDLESRILAKKHPHLPVDETPRQPKPRRKGQPSFPITSEDRSLEAVRDRFLLATGGCWL